jgi:hypothetical protein
MIVKLSVDLPMTSLHGWLARPLEHAGLARIS